MKRRVRCEYPNCNRVFWSKVKGGVALENFCQRCRNRIFQQEMREKHAKKKPKLPPKSLKKAKKATRREIPKIRGRTPDQIKEEIRWLEYRRAKELPKIKKDAHFHNLRIIQAHDVIAKTLKNLYRELEVAEKLGLKGHGKKKRK